MTKSFHSSQWHRVARSTPKFNSHVCVQHHRYRGQAWYVLHEPATGKVHRVTPLAFAFLRLLDGETTVESVWTSLIDRLEDNAPSQDEMIQLLAELHEAGILRGQPLPDVHELQHHVQKQRRAKLVNAVRHPLSVTVPLWDADAFLGRHLGKYASAFSVPGFLVWCAITMPALVMAALYYRELASAIVDSRLAMSNLFLLGLVFPFMKAIHEAGHACALKAFGGSVNRTGIILIAFLPMPYVDASSAALMPGRLRRMVVGAAGMMAELLVAAVAVLIWLSVEPGVIRSIAASCIAVAAISVLVVNGNPLLRFDGYFILTDLFGLPNLAQRSSKFWSRRVARLLTGVRDDTHEHASIGERVWFAVYGPLAFAYRQIVLLSLALWVATEYLVVGVVIAIISLLAGIVVPAAKGLARLMQQADARGVLRSARLRVGALVLAGVSALVLVPVPQSTVSEGILALPDDAFVRTPIDGFVNVVHASVGQRVRAGDPIVTRENLELATEVVIERARIAELTARLAAERFANRSRAQITQTEMNEALDRLSTVGRKVEHLVSRAGIDGTLFGTNSDRLDGRLVRKGETIAVVQPDHGWLVRAIVRQYDIELVRDSVTRVRIKLVSDPADAHEARVVREVPAAGQHLPSRALTVAGGGQLPVAANDEGEVRSAERSFEVELEFLEALKAPMFGVRALVRFDHRPEPLAVQAYRRLRQLLLSHFHA